MQRNIHADALTAETDFLDAGVERLLFSTDADQFHRNRRIEPFQRGDGKLIPAGEPHIGDQADFLLAGGLAQKLVGFVERGGQIRGAVGDLDGIEFS